VKYCDWSWSNLSARQYSLKYFWFMFIALFTAVFSLRYSGRWNFLKCVARAVFNPDSFDSWYIKITSTKTDGILYRYRFPDVFTSCIDWLIDWLIRLIDFGFRPNSWWFKSSYHGVNCVGGRCDLFSKATSRLLRSFYVFLLPSVPRLPRAKQ
jgi:hypothetical protein